MNRCPITYRTISNTSYHKEGLQLLHPSLTALQDLPYNSAELRKEAVRRMKKMSIQGVQAKLSAVLDVPNASFKLVNIHGKYIIKTQSDYYNQLPENEDVSMRMALECGIEIPLHGMLYSNDNQLNYFIKRFDRIENDQKLPLEDFAQLAGLDRDTKYDYSTEKMIKLLEEYCTFPAIEKIKFFKRILFSFLIGNEDMHLKNFSLITRNDKVELSPAYDLINSTLAMEGAEEELALYLSGKRKNFKRRDFMDYLAKERLGLSDETIQVIEKAMLIAYPKWKHWIEISFLNPRSKIAYLELLEMRMKRIF